MSTQKSLSLVGPEAQNLSTVQKIGVSQSVVGLAILLLATFNVNFPNKALFLFLALGLISLGVIVFARDAYLNKLPGIKNDGSWFRSSTSRGVAGWATGIFLTTFYIVLYFYPAYLGLGTNGAPNTGLVALFDPLSQLLSGRVASQWFVYGSLYTVLILVFGYKFMLKYRHNRYEQLRTISVMFFQLGFAFLIPEFMYRMNSKLPYYDLKNVWPLNYYFFDDWSIQGFLSTGNLGLFFIFFAVFSTFVITPVLTYKFGKRWYCSWVCGCGGLAETAGDSYRHLSSKTMVAWKIERWLIHTVLVFSVVMTTGVIYSYLGTDSTQSWFTKGVFISLVIGFLSLVFAATMIFKHKELGKDAKFGAIGFAITIAALLVLFFTGTSTEVFYIKSTTVRTAYGFYIGSIFSGVIGTGLYPLLGNRSWCRFGCPMAAILGFQQRMFSKFRITTNGGQCISCGNCSTFCEMGIDVRAYAQKGENIVRSSCVGCGICSAVCPRGVLKLENGAMEGRINPTQIPLGNDLALMDLVNLIQSKSLPQSGVRLLLF